jgi:hypothetical protein
VVLSGVHRALQPRACDVSHWLMVNLIAPEQLIHCSAW